MSSLVIYSFLSNEFALCIDLIRQFLSLVLLMPYEMALCGKCYNVISNKRVVIEK